MTITRPCYCTREQVRAALDITEPARANARIDRAIESAARAVEGLTHRVFWPELATRSFAWPNQQYARPWRLWLEQHELVSLTTLTSGSTVITSGQYYLEPNGTGPPYASIELRLDATAGFGGADTPQRSIAVTGVYGYRADTAPAGATAEILDASETGVDVTDSSAVGVGDLVLIDSEYMLVTDKAMLTTGQTLQAALTALASATTASVSSGTGFAVGETLLVDSERLLIEDISGNSLTVRRAYDGSVLAAHTGSTVYAARTLTVVRGYGGTTAATHTSGATVSRHAPPPLIRDLAIAYAINQLLQENCGYARVAGTGEGAREFVGRGLREIEADVYQRYGRKSRTRAV